ncbi:MAG: trypsin-like peptidase domain-containing protein [Candidatus Brocadiae bacterium]|nr:trypsin-like peptidase domain-containing protein [Candidatus Brocadiia bacterium]
MRQKSILNGLAASLLLVIATRSAWSGARQLTLRERVELGKAATALVEATRDGRAQGTGSAFCVHETGLFVTNRHVLLTRRPRSTRDDVRKIPIVKTVTLVLSPNERGQQEVDAQVLRVSDDFDLALLRAAGANRSFSRLALGSVEGLMEMTEVAAFGFPFGKALAVNRGSYPSVSVNTGRVTSLRKKGGDLSRIQVDAVLNPGNSGGPIIDAEGKAIGVVVSGVLGMGVNFAIPVSKVRQFLSRPEIIFTPPVLDHANQHELVEFQAKAVFFSPPKEPLALQMVLDTGAGGPRRYKMATSGGVHRVKTVPIPPRKGPLVLRIEARYPDGHVKGTVKDCTFGVGKKQIKLSQVSFLRFEPEAEVALNDGETLRGEVSGLSVVPVTFGEQSLRLKLDAASTVEVDSPSVVDAVICTIIARQANREVGRITTPVYVGGAARDRCLKLPGGHAYLRAAHHQSLDLTDTFTIAFWIKLADRQSQKYIITKRQLAPAYDDYAVIYGFTQGKFAFYSESYSGSRPTTRLKTPVSDTSWHHVAWTYDGSVITGYLDGKADVSAKRTFRIRNRAVDFYFTNPGHGDYAQSVDGLLDEVCLWNRPLSDEEIVGAMYRGLTGKEKGLVLYYRFDRAVAGNRIRDLSRHKNHGELHGKASLVPSDRRKSPAPRDVR